MGNDLVLEALRRIAGSFGIDPMKVRIEGRRGGSRRLRRRWRLYKTR